MELLSKTKTTEKKFVLELTQSEIGTLFACMDKVHRLDVLQSWNNQIGNNYDQLKEDVDWQLLKDLLHSVAIFSRDGVMKNGQVQ